MTACKTISGLFIFIFLIGKVIVHYYLDRTQGRSGGFLYTLLSPGVYFQWCKVNVDDAFVRLKFLSNLLLVLAFISLVINGVLGLTLYLNNR